MAREDYAYLIPHGVDPHMWIEAKRHKRELQMLIYLARGSCYLRDYLKYMIERYGVSESKARADLRVLIKYKLVRVVDQRSSKRSYIAVTSKGKLCTWSNSNIKSAVLAKNRITIGQLNKAKALLYVDRLDRAAGQIKSAPPTWKASNRVNSITERFDGVGRSQSKEYFDKIEARRFYYRDFSIDLDGRLHLACLTYNESDNELDVFLKVNKWISEFMLLVENYNTLIVLDLIIVTTGKYDQIKQVADKLIGLETTDEVEKIEMRDKVINKIMKRQKRKNAMDPDVNPFGFTNILIKIDISDPLTKIKTVALRDI